MNLFRLLLIRASLAQAIISPCPQPVPPPSPLPGGVVVRPGESVQAAVDKGGVVILEDGEHRGPVKITKPGTQLLARNTRRAFLKSGASNNLIIDADSVVVRGLVLQGGGQGGADNQYAANRVEKGRKGAILEDLTIEKAKGVGLAINGDNFQARRLLVQDNGAAGVGGSGPDGGVLEDSVIRRNNQAEEKSDGGGGKWTRTNGTTFRFLEYYGNVGPGLWLDVWNKNATIDSVYSHDNKGTSKIHGKGIMLELTGGNKDGTYEGKSFIKNSVVENNDVVSGRSKDNQRGFNISSSANIDMTNNSVLKGDILNLKDAAAREIHTKGITISGTLFKDGAKINYDGAAKSCCQTDGGGEGAKAPFGSRVALP